MSKSSLEFSDILSTPSPSAALRVFVAYETIESRLQAWSLYRHVAEDLSRGLDVRSAFCQFDVLASPNDREKTLEAVAQADIILFSMNTDSQLSPAIIYWIESWIPKQLKKNGGLLLLIENGGRAKRKTTFAENYLQGVAKRAGMDFRSQRVGVSATPAFARRDESWTPARIQQPMRLEPFLAVSP